MSMLRLAYLAVKMLLVILFDLSAISYPYRIKGIYIFFFVAGYFVRNPENF